MVSSINTRSLNSDLNSYIIVVAPEILRHVQCRNSYKLLLGVELLQQCVLGTNDELNWVLHLPQVALIADLQCATNVLSAPERSLMSFKMSTPTAIARWTTICACPLTILLNQNDFSECRTYAGRIHRAPTTASEGLKNTLIVSYSPTVEILLTILTAHSSPDSPFATYVSIFVEDDIFT